MGSATLKEDPECKIANSHHRQEQYPESVFYYDLMPDQCAEADMVCCVRGKMFGTIGDYDLAAGIGCGFTVNDLAEDAALDLEMIGYQQFTARTLIRVFLNATEIPESPGENEETEVKADFGLFLGDSGIVREEDQFVSQRMVLTGARKLPRGTKMKLDMVGAAPKMISGTLCGPNLIQILDNIAKKGEGMDDDEED